MAAQRGAGSQHGGESSRAAADTVSSTEQWVEHHGVATAAHAKAMLGLQRRRRSSSREVLEQLLKTEEVTRNHAFMGVLTGGDTDVDTYQSVVESIVQKLRTKVSKISGLDEVTKKLLSEYLDALQEHAEAAKMLSPSGAGGGGAAGGNSSSDGSVAGSMGAERRSSESSDAAAEPPVPPTESEDESVDAELAATLLWKAMRRWREWAHIRDKRSRGTRRTQRHPAAAAAATAAAPEEAGDSAGTPSSASPWHERGGDGDTLAQSWRGPSLPPSEYRLESEDPLARSVGDPFARSYGRKLGKLGGLLGQGLSGQAGAVGSSGSCGGAGGFSCGDSGAFDDESNVPGSDGVAMHEFDGGGSAVSTGAGGGLSRSHGAFSRMRANAREPALSPLNARALVELEAKMQLEERVRRAAQEAQERAELPTINSSEGDEGRSSRNSQGRQGSPSVSRATSVDSDSLKNSRGDASDDAPRLASTESKIQLSRSAKRVFWQLPDQWGDAATAATADLMSRSLPAQHEILLCRGNAEERVGRRAARRSSKRLPIDDMYLRRELGAASVGEPSGMVYQNELPSGANASVSVWRQTDGSLVVVKRFSLGRVQKRGVDLLINEVRLYHSLRHRHLVRFHGAFCSRGDLCIMLDYACGGTVEQVVERQQGRLFEDCFISEWLSQLAAAVLFMHENGVLHRDISAANVFLDWGGNVVVGDLGLAKRVAICSDSFDGPKDALAKTRCGTPDFLSPELVNGEEYGRPSDAWAVGVLLFYLLTLRKPFCSRFSTIFQVVEQIATGEPLPESQLALKSCGHPEELCSLASKAGLLNPDPAKRCTLEQVLERYPLEEPWNGDSGIGGAASPGSSGAVSPPKLSPPKLRPVSQSADDAKTGGEP